MKRKNKKSQSLLVYVVLFSVVGAALVVMFSYIRGAISGRFRQAADVFGGGEQYSYKKTIVIE